MASMEKLKLSFRILSKIPKKLSNEPTPTPHSFGFLSSLNPIHCLYKYPLFPKQNAQLQHQRRRLVQRLFFAGSQFPRRHYNQGYRSYNTRISGTPTSEIVTLGLLGVNLAVFGLWRSVDTAFMRKHFMQSVESFTSGRLHTLITSAFSQMGLEHLICNMIGLYYFGSRIEYHFGGKFLFKLYLAGALGGSIFYLVHHSFISPISKGSGIGTIAPKTIQGLGASGAVNAIMLLYIFLNPKAVFLYNFIIPIPGFLLGALLIGHDAYRIKENSGISGSAHLGGAFVAALKRTRIRKRF